MFGIIYIMSKTLRKILEGLKADFFQLLSTFTKFLVLERYLGTTLYLHTILKLFKNFLIY